MMPLVWSLNTCFFFLFFFLSFSNACQPPFNVLGDPALAPLSPLTKASPNAASPLALPPPLPFLSAASVATAATAADGFTGCSSKAVSETRLAEASSSILWWCRCFFRCRFGGLRFGKSSDRLSDNSASSGTTAAAVEAVELPLSNEASSPGVLGVSTAATGAAVVVAATAEGGGDKLSSAEESPLATAADAASASGGGSTAKPFVSTLAVLFALTTLFRARKCTGDGDGCDAKASGSSGVAN
mmetsp:Transcript_4619/g.11226  ORF Transcript_4619/g.11226 Transcript_4619/m.11226 type:complete len:243 (-) Transcript_4619:1486-2214(-)